MAATAADALTSAWQPVEARPSVVLMAGGHSAALPRGPAIRAGGGESLPGAAQVRV